jgi:hypothetical protein
MKRLKQLSWKQKNRLLYGGLLLCAWIIYAWAITPTLEAKYTCDQLQLQIDSAAQAPEQIRALEAELQRLDEITGTNNSHDSSTHEALLDLVTVYCESHALTLREFTSPVRFTQQEWLVETHPFTVEGDFIRLVQFLDHLRAHAPGNIVSADFHAKKDNKTKTTALLLTVYIQNISTLTT